MKSHLLAFSFMIVAAAPAAHAQNGSGSGNGSGNRDVLDYQTELRQSDLSIQSIDEALRKLRQELQLLAAQRTPQFNGPEAQFWNQLTNPGRQAVENFDQDLIRSIQQPLDLINEARASIRVELATIDATSRDQQHYADRGYAAALKRELRKSRRQTYADGKAQMAKIVDSLMIVLGNVDKENYLPHYANGEKVSKYFLACDTVPCIDLIHQRALSYVEFVKEIVQTRVQILSDNRTLAAWHDRYAKEEPRHGPMLDGMFNKQEFCIETTKQRLNYIVSVIAKIRFDVIYSKNKQAIKAANNPTP